MDDLFLALFLLTFVALIVGLINPSIFSRITKKDFNRKKVSLYCGGALVLFFVLFGITSEPTEKETPEVEPATQQEEITENEEAKPEATEATQDPEPEKATEPIQETTQEEVEVVDKVEVEQEATEPEPTPEPEETATQQTGADLLPVKAEADAIIKTNAEDKWGDDFRMVKYEIDRQTKAFSWLIKQTNHLSILERAINKWGDDFRMVRYEYEKQVEAYESL